MNSNDKTDTQVWLQRAELALEQTSELSMMCEEYLPGELNIDDESLTQGTSIRIDCDSQSVDIIMLSNPQGIVDVAKLMLGLDEDDDPPSAQEVEDCMREAVNIIAGVILLEVEDGTEHSSIGLPEFKEYGVESYQSKEHSVKTYFIDNTKVKLVAVLRN